MWKKIHVELKFLRFEFHHFIFLLLKTQHSAFLLLPRVLLCADLKVQLFNQISSILRSSSVHRSSSDLFIVSDWTIGPSILHSFFFLAFFRPSVLLPADLKVQSFNQISSVLRSSSDLFFVRLFFLFFFRSAFNCPIGAPALFVLRSSFFLCSSFRSVFLQVPKSSLRDLVLLFRTRVYKTRDLSGIIFLTHQVGIESLTIEF